PTFEPTPRAIAIPGGGRGDEATEFASSGRFIPPSGIGRTAAGTAKGEGQRDGNNVADSDFGGSRIVADVCWSRRRDRVVEGAERELRQGADGVRVEDLACEVHDARGQGD